jgi:hypothetical protein
VNQSFGEESRISQEKKVIEYNSIKAAGEEKYFSFVWH